MKYFFFSLLNINIIYNIIWKKINFLKFLKILFKIIEGCVLNAITYYCFQT